MTTILSNLSRFKKITARFLDKFAVSDFFKSLNIWQSFKQESCCLMHFAHLVNTLLKDEKSERNFAKYSPIKKFTDRFNNKLFLIWLLTAPLHVKYVATLP